VELGIIAGPVAARPLEYPVTVPGKKIVPAGALLKSVQVGKAYSLPKNAIG